MKPITDMTTAEIDAEIVRRAWPNCSVDGESIRTSYQREIWRPVPSLSLDTCIAAMEAGGVEFKDIALALYLASVSADISAARQEMAEVTLSHLRTVQEPRRD